MNLKNTPMSRVSCCNDENPENQADQFLAFPTQNANLLEKNIKKCPKLIGLVLYPSKIYLVIIQNILLLTLVVSLDLKNSKIGRKLP